jgi:hypothetical protein
MSTATVGRPRRVNKAAIDAEEKFVDELMKITKPVFSKMSRSQREHNLRKLKEYLASLDESVAKRA